ncbi:MAG: Mn2+ and Fe2+ transporters of the NRAMP family [Candidatus Peregrinibacteria bacterium Greene0416_19]|nr:MAG: Mn2+ and Fe2+ transporters of the NRAMP family [Candidatus Peregrinibacteria bacterium Greene0416_19]
MSRRKSFLQRLGPGFITGASDDDPSGIATYAQTGAQFGYRQLWASLYTLPFMIAVQEMCGRIGLVTGKGLAGVIRKHYSRPLLYTAAVLLLVANTVNIGADLGAMASAAELVTGLPFVTWLLGMTVVTLVLEVFVSYRVYARYLKYLTLSLLAYVVTALAIAQDWPAAFAATLIPTFTFSKDSIMNLVAFLGTTISPYLFFWQASEEVEEEVAEGKLRTMGMGKPHIDETDMRNMRIDTVLGMTFSNLVTFFIIVTAASTLHRHGITQINTAVDAARALEPVAGSYAALLFALGIIGTGLLAVPVLAGSASYALAEALDWKEGLYRKFRDAHGFYGIITLATVAGLLVNFIGVPPFRMLYAAAILNGIIAPPLLLIILLIANDRRIMGRQVNNSLSNVLGSLITLLMALAAVALFVL